MNNRMVHARVGDGDVRYATLPAQMARNILMHERELCDDCLEAGGNNRVYLLDNYDPKDYPVMYLMCEECAMYTGMTEGDMA